MISGELFQSLADICFYDQISDIMLQQCAMIPQNIKRVDEVDVADISKYKRIFVYTHSIDIFCSKFLPHLSDNTVIITHNSDAGIQDKCLLYLQSPKITKWFCQNKETEHVKLYSLPIGLANSQWVHGNQQMISQIREENNKKEILVFKNFNINTNYGERVDCEIKTSSTGIQMHNTQSVENYWRSIAKSLFIISPIGNGVDCHRIWESLFLRSVPVVKYHKAFNQFTHLPILFINDWSEVTVERLRSEANRFMNYNFNIEELEIEYWKNKILI